MKRILLIASAVAIVAGCAKVTTVDTAEPQEIAFKAYNYAATKAPINGSIFPYDRDMAVHAIFKDGTTTSEYFDNVQFTAKQIEGNSLWSGGKFWPPQGTLRFNAVSPSEGSSNSILSNLNFNYENGENLSYITGSLADNSTEQLDLLIAASTDFTPAPSSSNTGIDITFHHALSLIQIKAKAGAEDLVKVKGIVLNTCYQSGNFYVYPATDSDFATDVNWNVNGINATNLNLGVQETELGVSADSELKSVLVVPAINEGTKPTLTITYDFDSLTDLVKTVDLFPAETSIKEWQSGKKYTYSLTFTANEILLDPSIDEWDDYPTSEGVDVPVQ